MKRLSAPAAFLVLAVLLAAAVPAASQPAGWVRERIGLLSLEGPPEAGRAVRALALEARTILPQLQSELGARFTRRFQIVLLPGGTPDDPALARMDEAAPPWAAGYLVPELRIGAIRIAQASRYPYGTLESVLAHESAHMLLHDAAQRTLPLWFEEGVATWLDRRWTAEDVWIYSRALLTSDLPALADLDRGFRASADEAELAYAASFAFISWNARRQRPGFLRDVLRGARTRRFAAAWEAAAGVPLEKAEAAWRQETLIRYRWIPLLTASSTLWIAISLLAILAGVRRRARARAQRERWAAEEQEEPEERL